MNYIVHFKTRNAEKQITVQQIKDYFSGRGGYTVNDYQVLYSNEDTAVFYTFEYGKHQTREISQSPAVLPVYFSLSYGKPHIFALEAETELVEFIHTFDLLTSDLFMKGTEFSDYRELDFYRGWNDGNESFYRELLKKDPQTKLNTLPVDLMEKCWRWNYHVSEMQAELGPEIFVPKIMYILHRSVFSTAVVWTDGQPITLPRVEKAILYRRTLAPGIHLGNKEDVALINISEVEPLLKDFSKTTEHLEYYTIIYKDTPKEIKHLIQTPKTTGKDDLVFVPFSEVHDRELIEKIRGH
jgi:hypothetical protein